MCVKEFYGFTCGHCSIPTLRLCPLTLQASEYPACPHPAELPIQTGSNCPACSRVVWNQEVLAQEEHHRQQHERGECMCATKFNIRREYALAPLQQDNQIPIPTDAHRKLRARPGGGKGRKNHESRGFQASEHNGNTGGPWNNRQQNWGLQAMANEWRNTEYQGPAMTAGSRTGYGQYEMGSGTYSSADQSWGSMNTNSTYIGPRSIGTQASVNQQVEPVYVPNSLLYHYQPNSERSSSTTQVPSPEPAISDSGSCRSSYVGFRVGPGHPVEYAPNQRPKYFEKDTPDGYASEGTYHRPMQEHHRMKPRPGYEHSTPEEFSKQSGDDFDRGAYPSYGQGQDPSGTSAVRYQNTVQSPLGSNAPELENTIPPYMNLNENSMPMTKERTYPASSTAVTRINQQDSTSHFSFSMNDQNYGFPNTFQPYGGYAGANGMKYHPESSAFPQQMPLPATIPQTRYNSYKGNESSAPRNAPKAPRGERTYRSDRRGSVTEKEAVESRFPQLRINTWAPKGHEVERANATKEYLASGDKVRENDAYSIAGAQDHGAQEAHELLTLGKEEDHSVEVRKRSEETGDHAAGKDKSKAIETEKAAYLTPKEQEEVIPLQRKSIDLQPENAEKSSQRDQAMTEKGKELSTKGFECGPKFLAKLETSNIESNGSGEGRDRSTTQAVFASNTMDPDRRGSA